MAEFTQYCINHAFSFLQIRRKKKKLLSLNFSTCRYANYKVDFELRHFPINFSRFCEKDEKEEVRGKYCSFEVNKCQKYQGDIKRHN